MTLDELLDASYAPRYVDQGSENWEKIRAGRFTSSEIHNIMQFGFRPMTEAELKARPKTGTGSKTTRVPDPQKFSEKGMTYIYQKVAEVMTGQPKPSSYAYPLVYGKETEPLAVEHFEKITGLISEEVGFQTWGDHAGGSPDRLLNNGAGLEIKCPFQSENQIKYMMLNDRHDLKALYPNYYWQVVSLMLFTDRKEWYFCTFDPRMIEEKHKMTHLIIKWEEVEEDIDLLVKALEGAIKIKLETLNLLR